MAKLRVAVGSLPLGAEDTEPSTDGSAPAALATPRGSLSAVVPLIFFIDETGYQRTADRPIDGVDTRLRFSADGETWGGWGAGLTVPGPITTSGVQCYAQARGFVGDGNPLALKLIVPQDGIEAVAAGTLPAATEAASEADASALLSIGLLSGTDAATASDAATLGYGGLIGVLPSVSDTDSETDTVTLYVIRPLGAAADGASGSDAVALVGIRPIGAAADTDAETDAGAMATATPSMPTYYGVAGANLAIVEDGSTNNVSPATAFQSPCQFWAKLGAAGANVLLGTVPIELDVLHDATLSAQVVAPTGNVTQLVLGRGAAMTATVTLTLPAGKWFVPGNTYTVTAACGTLNSNEDGVLYAGFEYGGTPVNFAHGSTVSISGQFGG